MSNIKNSIHNRYIWPIVLFVMFLGFFMNTKNVSALESADIIKNSSNEDHVIEKSEVIEQSEERVSVNDVADNYKQLLSKLKTNETEQKEAIREHEKEVARQKAEAERKRKEKICTNIVDVALSKRGKKYVWGATGPNTFDCSGLTQWAYRQNGIYIPRVAASQSQNGERIKKSQLRKGDLIFFRTDSSTPRRISHVGIYIGNGRMVHAPSTGDVVKISSIYSPYWSNRYAWSCRYVN